VLQLLEVVFGDGVGAILLRTLPLLEEEGCFLSEIAGEKSFLEKCMSRLKRTSSLSSFIITGFMLGWYSLPSVSESVMLGARGRFRDDVGALKYKKWI